VQECPVLAADVVGSAMESDQSLCKVSIDLKLQLLKISANFDQGEDRMISSFRNSLALSSGCLIATLAFQAGAAAESIENQCRIAVRAEMMGPECRMINPKTSSGGYTAGDPCYILGDTKTAYYIDRVIECVKRGGLGKR
jgi:hypothetical protein